jgi:hypothetical protein
VIATATPGFSGLYSTDRLRVALGAAIATLATIFFLVPQAAQSGELEYNRDLRPILADACFACHGPDSASRKADLRLDQRQAAIDMSAIDPGHPELSEMVSRINSSDPDEVMPPPETKKVLTDRQKEILTQWIREGAEYQLHWSFIPPRKSPLPNVKQTGWVRNPIDRFILARLEAAGLTPAPEADRRSLARRLSFDLTGLPPKPELVKAFVEDTSPNAYESLVDKLLDSAAWGEHRGRYWLDYARYADTHGIHFDNYREMWSYRDWVIDAFNSNMPFDQFTIENLAGDLLPNATLEQRIGSGFNRCNMTTNEGGIIDEEYLVLYTRDRTETTSQVWMGLTAGCAVCHSHKFDPLTQREFYEMAAFFNNTTQAAKDGNIKDTPPILVVPRDEDRERWFALQPEIQQAQASVDNRKKEARALFDAWVLQATPEIFSQYTPSDKLLLHAPLDEERSFATVTVNEEPRQLPLAQSTEWEDGKTGPRAARISKEPLSELADVGDFEADQPFSVAAWVKVPANDGSGAIVARIDNKNDFRGWDLWLEGRRLGSHIISRWNSDALKVVAQKQIPANKWVHVALTYDGTKSGAGVKIYYDGTAQPARPQADALRGTIRTDVPLKIGQRNTTSLLSGAAINDLRIYGRALAASEVASLGQSSRLAAILKKKPEQRKEAELNDIFDWWLIMLDPPYQKAHANLEKLERERNELKSRGTIAHVMQEKPEDPMAYILNRGEYDQRRDPVTPDTPDVLPPFPKDYPRDRLGFAKWLLLPTQPLTSRVTVNRFWQEVFGTGLVKTSGDFGVMGELPSHPELLDWLAMEFVESGWDVKQFFKLMVMSAAYRQSAVVSPEKWEQDGENRLLSRGPRFRLDAEMIRDSALAASGLLVPKIGGPSVKPYQPDGLWEVVGMMGSTTRYYKRDTGPKLYRRSLYTFVKRMAPPASLEIFNAPNRETCTVRRERTNTPLQALVTLNDEQFIEAARALAQHALKNGGTSHGDRLNFIGQRLISRDFNAEEQKIIAASLSDLSNYYAAHADDAELLIHVGESEPDASVPAAELASWTMLTNELMNLDEVLNK